MGNARIAMLVFAMMLVAQHASAQTNPPREDTVAIGGDVGFLAGYWAENDIAGTVDVFVEYYYTPRVSLRGLYGWADAADVDVSPDRSIRRQQVALNVVFNHQFGRVRPFGAIGGGVYFFQRREAGENVGQSITKPGGNVGWGVEFDLRTFVVRTEMNVQMLTGDDRFPEVGDKTLSGFSWVFGLKTPF